MRKHNYFIIFLITLLIFSFYHTERILAVENFKGDFSSLNSRWQATDKNLVKIEAGELAMKSGEANFVECWLNNYNV